MRKRLRSHAHRPPNLASRIRPQLVFGWTPSPGKALYVGHNDDKITTGFNPYTGKYEPRMAGNGRSFFIKMSYLFKKSFKVRSGRKFITGESFSFTDRRRT